MINVSSSLKTREIFSRCCRNSRAFTTKGEESCTICFFCCTIKPRLLHFSLCLRLQLSLFFGFPRKKEGLCGVNTTENLKKGLVSGACGKRGWSIHFVHFLYFVWNDFVFKLWKKKIKMKREPKSTAVYYVGMMQLSKSSTSFLCSLFAKKKYWGRRERGTKHVSTAK